jgi:hypothetical protein
MANINVGAESSYGANFFRFSQKYFRKVAKTFFGGRIKEQKNVCKNMGEDENFRENANFARKLSREQKIFAKEQIFAKTHENEAFQATFLLFSTKTFREFHLGNKKFS